MKRYILLGTLFCSVLLSAEELKIVADAFTANEKAGYTVFKGNVHIKKGHDELNASKVEVFIDKDRTPTKYIADGSASFFIKTEDNSTYQGKAQRVVFLPLDQEYRFHGNVHLKQIDQQKQIDGEEVVVNIKKGTATAKGAKKQPVIMIFNLPEEKKQ